MAINETQPFDPRQDINRDDLHRVEASIKRAGWFNVLTARDVLVCFPEKLYLMNIPPQTVDQVIQGIKKDAADIDSERDVARILSRVSALKQLSPELDPHEFDGVQFLERPLLESVRENFIMQDERAQHDRTRTIPIPYPRWRYNGARGLTSVADFQIITHETPLAIVLGQSDKEEGKEMFHHYSETMNPWFRTRGEYVADALEVGAGLRVLFPELHLDVKPDFWKEARTLMLATKDTDLTRYIQQARQATMLAGKP